MNASCLQPCYVRIRVLDAERVRFQGILGTGVHADSRTHVSESARAEEAVQRL